jgi:hypothetical protein
MKKESPRQGKRFEVQGKPTKTEKVIGFVFLGNSIMQ